VSNPERRRRAQIAVLLAAGVDPYEIVKRVLLTTTNAERVELARLAIIDEVAEAVANTLEREDDRID
jgi:hypothetical protein